MLLEHPQFKFFKYDSLSQDQKTYLKTIAQREFGHIPIVKQHVWAQADWSGFVILGNSPVSTINLVERTVEFDGIKKKTIGIHNLITETNGRKKGLGSSLMTEAIGFSQKQLQAEALLLFCADDLVSFYKKFGFKKVKCPVWIEQPTGRKTWASNCMVHSKNLPLQQIDLCGLPW